MAPPVDLDDIRRRFDTTTPLTIGLEEEVLLLVPDTFGPAPEAEAVVTAASHPSVKTELPACQVELVTRPHPDVVSALEELREARLRLLRACAGALAPAAAAVHPTAVTATLGSSPRHVRLQEEWGEIARSQLVGSLQVHVALGSADLTLAVHDALRTHLPELAALAAAAPFRRGRDTGLASVRPLISGSLPRQGVPPPLSSWDHVATELGWGHGGALDDAGCWWWELRPHLELGTLEVRVPDVQPTLSAAAAVVGTVHALIAHLAERVEHGERPPVIPTWRIEENRWRALRDGVHGTMFDPMTGEPEAISRRIGRLLDRIEPHAPGGLDSARCLLRHNTADELRRVGPAAAAAHLAASFPPSDRSDAVRPRTGG